jgi:hypothetical protein
MKLAKLCLAIACACGLATASFAQEAQIRKPLGSTGYLDQRAGGFLLLPMAPNTNPSGQAPAATLSTGTITVTFSITVSSAIASTAKIACTATAQIVEIQGSSAFETEDTASVVATRNTSNGTASCTVELPYSWNLATASKDTVVLGYELDAPAEATGTAVYPARHTIGWIATIPVPTNGTTTPETVTAAL